ncbi:unnamed protein product [Sympodiomycopsis kandeliae]
MARDRLAAMRAQQAGGGGAGGYGGYGGGNNGYGDHAYPTQQTGGYDQGGYGQQQQGGYGQQQQGGYGQQQQAGYGQQQGGYGQQQGGYAQQQGGYGQSTSAPAYNGYAAQQQPQQPQAGGYDQQFTAPANGGANSYEMQEKPAGGDMNSFFAEISEIQDMIREIEDNVRGIANLHNQSLNNVDEAASQQAHAQLGTVSQGTSRLTNAVKNRIKKLEQQTSRVPEGGDKNVRRTQIGSLKNQFKGVIQNYQEVEQQYRQKFRQRQERQFRIVKPDATPQEVKAALDDDNGGQIFSQALLNSNRHGEARGALREVQERHEDIKRIEKTIVELAQLFQEMDILISEQDDQVNAIESTAVNVEQDMSSGLAATGKAVKSAKAARKKRKICFIISIVLILVIAAVVAIVVCTRPGNCGKKDNGGGNTAARRSLAGSDADVESLVELWARYRMDRAFGIEY